MMAVRDPALNGLVPIRSAARLREFREDVERALPGMVDRVVLFGSRARGEARGAATLTWPC